MAIPQKDLIKYEIKPVIRKVCKLHLRYEGIRLGALIIDRTEETQMEFSEAKGN